MYTVAMSVRVPREIIRGVFLHSVGNIRGENMQHGLPTCWQNYATSWQIRDEVDIIVFGKSSIENCHKYSETAYEYKIYIIAQHIVDNN